MMHQQENFKNIILKNPTASTCAVPPAAGGGGDGIDYGISERCISGDELAVEVNIAYMSNGTRISHFRFRSLALPLLLDTISVSDERERGLSSGETSSLSPMPVFLDFISEPALLARELLEYRSIL